MDLTIFQSNSFTKKLPRLTNIFLSNASTIYTIRQTSYLFSIHQNFLVIFKILSTIFPSLFSNRTSA